MISKNNQDQFIALVKSKLTVKEADWINARTDIVSKIENSNKFSVFFSLASRFIGHEEISWNTDEFSALENIYPGFEKTIWTKLDLARVILMMTLDVSINEETLKSFFEIADMKEQTSLYKGLYLLENASDFEKQTMEGIRTNMVNVFDAIASGNPFAQTYLNEDAWNQLILKSFFLDRKLYNIQNIDQGKNENLANMLQDYIKERWAAGRQVSLEIWRMLEGYLREDIKTLLSGRQFKGIEKEIIDKILNQDTPTPKNYWDEIGKTN